MHFLLLSRCVTLLVSLLAALPSNTAAIPLPSDSKLLLRRDESSQSLDLFSSESDPLILASGPTPPSSNSFNDLDGVPATDLFSDNGVLGLDGTFQVAVNPPEDDQTIHVGEGIDPGRWWEGNDDKTDIFIHCCDDIEAELQAGCIRQPSCANGGQAEESQPATPPPTPMNVVGGVLVPATAAVFGFGLELGTGAALLLNMGNNL